MDDNLSSFRHNYSWHRTFNSSAFRWIDKEEVTIVFSLFLSHICSAANRAGKWPYVCQDLISLMIDSTASGDNAPKNSVRRCRSVARTRSGGRCRSHLDSLRLGLVSSVANQSSPRYMSSSPYGQRAFDFQSGIGLRTC